MKMFRNRKLLIFIFVLIAAGGFFVYKNFFVNKQQATMQTEKVSRGTLVVTVSASGQIQTVGVVTVSTQASGVIKNIFVKSGDAVEQGQKIMELTLDQQGQERQSQTLASYLQAKNQLEAANATFFSLQSTMFSKWKTYTDLATNSTYQNPDGSANTSSRTLTQFTTAQDDWLAAEANFKNQQSVIAADSAAVSNAYLVYQMSSSVVTSPIAGKISDITLAPGMTISNAVNATTNVVSSQKIASIKNETKPIAQFSLSELDIASVAEGNKATITLDAMPSKTFTGKVIGIDRTGTVSSSVTSYPITVQFDSDNSEILPNMAATANIITKIEDNVLLVPSQAIQTSSGQNFVRVIKNGQISEVPVEVGLASGAQTEITSGISEGDEVVISVNSANATQRGTSPFGAGGGGFGVLRGGGFGGGR